MQDNSTRLAPFIKEYVFRNGWQGLRPVQNEAIGVILDTKDNLLLSCGTSSGKTEAAFFPILTQIEKMPKDGVSVLYIAPLKALINDQFERITYLCKSAGISVYHRHGDVSSRNKEEFTESPSGILQITPESLESLLICHGTKIRNIFRNLKFVVIDELHALLGTDRGGQVLCQISRIMKIAEVNPRLVGLSATVGSTESACRMLSKCNDRSTVCPSFGGEKLDVSLLYEYFEDIHARDEFIYDAVKKKNSLVFSNSREETEKITASLRDISAKRHDNGDIFIHHGNISASLRHDAEKALKSPSRHTVVCATSTLELGIDIGRLERVVSLGTPNTVSSFLQRLGRSGRRGNTPEMLSVFTYESEKDNADRYDILPFELLQGIAIVELYRRERFVESAKEKKYPYSLLAHQTLSVLASSIEGLSLPELARTVLTLAPFSGISSEDYKLLLSHLYAKGNIDRCDDGKVILGLGAEKMINSFKFYAVFKEEVNYTVRDEDGKEIGEIPEAVSPGGKFSLAGRVWICERLDSEQRIIYARAAKGKLSSFWRGSLTGIDDKIAEYVKKILSEDEIYPYLGKNAARVLTSARKLAKDNGLLDYPMHKLDDDLYIILPWFGSSAMNTLCRFIRKTTGGIVTSRTVIENPYVLSLHLEDKDIDEFLTLMRAARYVDESKNISLIDDSEGCFTEKYDYLVPKPLLQKAYAGDRMNAKKVSELIELL
ncbi:MAG: DEAD/DEAH box helicase [Clostridia bacterium]|nr:DEAD/DEAH box helicase [Clostridia bacterium]